MEKNLNEKTQKVWTAAFSVQCKQRTKKELRLCGCETCILALEFLKGEKTLEQIMMSVPADRPTEEQGTTDGVID